MSKKNGNKRWMLWICLGIAVAILAILVLIAIPWMRKLAYPLKYKETIQENAEKYDLDPYLICGVIHTESKFEAEAQSDAGAIGLMQIMPDTGAWIADKMGLQNFSESQLTDPEINISLGCWYLRYLMDKFDNDLTLVLASYNAGPTRVSQWLEDSRYSQNGTLVSIPYSETKTYVERVQDAKEVYQSYYQMVR